MKTRLPVTAVAIGAFVRCSEAICWIAIGAEGLEAWPRPSVTTSGPVDAPPGTVTFRRLAVTPRGLAVAPLKVTRTTSLSAVPVTSRTRAGVDDTALALALALDRTDRGGGHRGGTSLRGSGGRGDEDGQAQRCNETAQQELPGSVGLRG